MSERVSEVLVRWEPEVRGLGPWAPVYLNVPDDALEQVAAAIAQAIGAYEKLDSGETALLGEQMGRSLRAQFQQLVDIADDVFAGRATWPSKGSMWPRTMLESATESELEGMAAARGMMPEELELQVVRLGIEALKREEPPR